MTPSSEGGAPRPFDAIVIGVGGMGGAALYRLARRGLRVLGLERLDIPHDLGSSHGLTRIIRLAYYEHPSYVPLLRRAYTLWRELEALAGEPLLHLTGSIDAGPPGGQVFEGARCSCQVHDLPHEVLTAADLAHRFPGYALPADTLAVLQPEGGYLRPERCIVPTSRARSTWGPRCTAGTRCWGGRVGFPARPPPSRCPHVRARAAAATFASRAKRLAQAA